MIEFAGEYPRGGTVLLALNFTGTEGEQTSDFDLVEADVRFAGFKPDRIAEDMEKVDQFEVQERPDNEGWFLSFDAPVDLPLGWYVVDVRFTIDGTVLIGAPACFQITEAVTRRP